MLAARDVATYLLERQLINEQAIVDGNLTVIDASRRNSNFKVITEDGPSYLLKQGIGANSIATVAHEAALYQRFHADSQYHDLAGYLPHYYAYDPDQHVLIVELFRDAQDMQAYQSKRTHFSMRLAASMGHALAALHRERTDDGNHADWRSETAVWQPWALSISLPALADYLDMSSGTLQLTKSIQQFHEFGLLLDQITQAPATTALIHGDIKWDNWLVVAPSTPRARPTVKLVDWELSTFGDPCWDVGSAFSDYLSFWLRSIPITGSAPPDRFMELARFPLEHMQPAMRAFWHSYRHHMAFTSETADAWLFRCVQLSAARLLQTAFEELQMAHELTGTSVCMLQLSLNMLKQPEAAAVHLLGLPLQEEASA
jgi:hypothetical protein